jgi:hypothetical protein
MSETEARLKRAGESVAAARTILRAGGEPSWPVDAGPCTDRLLHEWAYPDRRVRTVFRAPAEPWPKDDGRERLSPLVLQALRRLGRSGTTTDVVRHLRSTLWPKHKAELISNQRYAPAWMVPVLHAIAGHGDVRWTGWHEHPRQSAPTCSGERRDSSSRSGRQLPSRRTSGSAGPSTVSTVFCGSARNWSPRGGTSLSKAHGAIQRFSEDVDLLLSREDLGFGGARDPEDPKIASTCGRHATGRPRQHLA